MDETRMAASSLLIWLSHVQASTFGEDLSNFFFFRAIYDFLHSEIDGFAIHLLGRTMTWVGAAAMTLLTLWILIRGYRIVTGQSRQPMMALVTDSLRATLILGLATGMAVGGSTLYDFLGTGLSQVINKIVIGSDTPVNERIDRNLAYLQLAWSSIEAVDTSGDGTLAAAKSRALWFTGIGIAGPSITGGALLLLNQIAMALFIGLGPLFVVSLLFESTKPLFSRWLHYGIGTMFSLAVLSTMVSIALKMVLAVAATFWVGHFTGAGEGISRLALQQGGMGVILTALILSAPPMAAAFFGGVLGNFIPFSVFGGGGRRSDPDHASPAHLGYEPAPMTNAPTAGALHHHGVSNGVALDQIKQLPANVEGDSFLDRYPNALASNDRIGGGDPLPSSLHATARAALPPPVDAELPGLAGQAHSHAPTPTASPSRHHLENSDRIGAGLEVAGLTAEGVERIADAGRLHYGLQFTPATGYAADQFIASGGKAVPMMQDVAPYLGKNIPADGVLRLGGSLDWSKAAPAAKVTGVVAGLAGWGLEGVDVYKAYKAGTATAGDYGHFGMTSAMTGLGMTGVGAPVALTWAAVDLAAQSYHYTPVYATEYGNVEINGWRAMRATAIDNRERGIRTLMREKPDLDHKTAAELFDARDLARRMEQGPK